MLYEVITGEEQQRREQRGGGVGDAAGEREDRERGTRVGERGAEAHRPFGVAEERGGGSDRPGDHRRLGKISPRRVERPRPVLRFVESYNFV